MTCAFYSIVYDIVFLIERKINYFIIFYFILVVPNCKHHKTKNVTVVSVMWCLHFVTLTFCVFYVCAATFSNSYVKRRLHYVMLRFVAVPSRVVVQARPASQHRLEPCPSYVAWRSGMATSLSWLSWVRFVQNFPTSIAMNDGNGNL